MKESVQSGDIRPGSPEERKGLALAALIISLAAVFCAFIPGWKIFAASCAVVSIAVAVFCIAKAKRPGSRARLALWALGFGILAILVIGYFLLTRPGPTEGTPVINEPVQQVSPAEDVRALDQLQQVTDSSGQH